MSITELLTPIYNDKDLQRFSLEEKAVKILQKFIENSQTYLSLNAARQNFRRSITTQDTFTIVAVLEHLGYLIGKLDKGRMVFKFNDTAQRTEVAVPLSQIEAAQKRFQEKLAKKVERAAKTIEKYKNLGSLVAVVDSKEDKKEYDLELERQLTKGVTPQKEYTPTFVSVKTALELHEAKECNSSVCRFCAMAQDKEIGI